MKKKNFIFQFQHLDKLSEQFIHKLSIPIIQLMKMENREIIKSILNYVKIMLKILPIHILQLHIENLVNNNFFKIYLTKF